MQNLVKLFLCELSAVSGLLAPIPYVFAGAPSATVRQDFPSAQKSDPIYRMCWKDPIEIYQNDYGVSGNQRSCEKRLLTFYMLFGLTCCSNSPLG